MKVRQDAWSHEDDVLLAETVLKHIKEGSTQLRAFDEVGDELNRTSAACGFRWNAVVRNRFMKQIAEAKKERKERKRAASFSYYPQMRPMWTPQPMMEHMTQSLDSEMSLESVVQYLQTLAQSNAQTPALQRENEKLAKENNELLIRNQELERELKKIKQDNSIIEEDYQSLIQIMNRARRLAILEDEDSLSSASFKMDKNGNLEKLAK
ncbi:RsfA family transcriptional regulator [Halalkalibacter akibai]|uniref:Prespore specific transcriptional activator RsfA n=1 Tax=Halalkalibacter akibai (strain ATCC 43226 / DSM 21942 / CIP 109018 / JCM 9157 / 1139) TaxID=1236973 RepID=W4QTZ3_HALA3|nr:RsfA family transcriptional regulator [Halalkalibacter akibai]GAE35078.1 prespore specific transcriptional activator RsfA [Halalkalibacter akibai JCM 9157]